MRTNQTVVGTPTTHPFAAGLCAQLAYPTCRPLHSRAPHLHPCLVLWWRYHAQRPERYPHSSFRKGRKERSASGRNGRMRPWVAVAHRGVLTRSPGVAAKVENLALLMAVSRPCVGRGPGSPTRTYRLLPQLLLHIKYLNNTFFSLLVRSQIITV